MDGGPGLTPVPFEKKRDALPRLSKPYVPGRHSDRFWTETDDAILREWYPKGGVFACAVRLPPQHSSKASIYARAFKLGIRRQGNPNRDRVRHDYGPAMDERIRAEWPLLDGKKRGTVSALADRLGVPRWWLGRRAVQLQLEVIPHRKEPPWTAAETALMEKVPLHDLQRSAQIFREHGFLRSAIAIAVRAKRLGLSRRATHTALSAYEAAKIVGFDAKNFGTMILAGDLQADRRADRRLPQQGGSRWMIEKAELRRFVLDNLERIDFRKVDKFALVDLLVGGLPSPTVPAPSTGAERAATAPDAADTTSAGEAAHGGAGVPPAGPVPPAPLSERPSDPDTDAEPRVPARSRRKSTEPPRWSPEARRKARAERRRGARR